MKGSEQGRRRHCIIVQNDVGNLNSPITTIIPLTDAKHIKKMYPVYILIDKTESGLGKDSVALCSQIKSIDQEERILARVGHLSDEKMKEINLALKIQLDLTEDD